ncbi:SH3 domain-containing protein [Brevundimonas diminuta]|uniref:SH3 domain-containing protein n=1 Tax=Brevundimonas diminuta TaxID=293 RepID=UPI003F7D84A6
MNRYALALTATSALIAAFATPAEAQIFGRRGNAETTQVINETPRCTQNLGTVAIAETQGVLFDQMGLGAPTELLRTVMDLVERERSLGGGARVRTADFVLVAELANPIEPTDNDRGSGLLGSLAAVGGRALLTAGLAAATGGEMGGGLGGFGGLGASLNPLQMQALNAATNMAGNVLGGQGGQAAQGPAPSLNANTVERIRDLKKDIGRGKEDAQVVFSLASVPLAETVGNTRAVANKGDLRSLRIRDNHFGGRVGAGYESEEEGKIIALAMVRGYADLVTSLGGTGSQIPEVTRANREAIAAETANREAEARRVAAEERRELERAEREREAERRRIRDEIRREEDDRRRYAERPSMSPSMSSRSLALPTILRAAPDGETIRPLAAREVVFPTGKERGGWIEVLDSDDNIGWVQNERLAPAR